MSTELPDWIFGSLIEDLGEFYGEEEVTLDSCAAHAARACAEAEEAIRNGETTDEWWARQKSYLYTLARWHVTNEERWRALYEQFPPPHPGAALFDFGCGIGTHTLAFASMGWYAVGIDLSEQAIGFARYRKGKYRDSYGAPQHGLTLLSDPYRGGLFPFDLIFAHDVLGHLVQPVETVRNLSEQLVPGARFYATLNNSRRTDENTLHRNAEIDFPGLFESLGLKRESALVWRKPE